MAENNQRQELEQKARLWQDFSTRYNIPRFTTPEQIQALAKNKGLTLDTALLESKQADEALILQTAPTEPHQEDKPARTGIGTFLNNTLIPLSLLIPPHVLEEDHDYIKIVDDAKNEWKKDHKANDFLSPEGLDFLYGSPEDDASESVFEIAEKKYREKAAEEASKGKNKKQKRLAKYDKNRAKIETKNPTQDGELLRHQNEIHEHVSQRVYVWQKENPKATKLERDAKEKEVTEKIETKTWKKFAAKHPEKVKAYFNHPKFQKTLESNPLLKTAFDHAIAEPPLPETHGETHPMWEEQGGFDAETRKSPPELGTQETRPSPLQTQLEKQKQEERRKKEQIQPSSPQPNQQQTKQVKNIEQLQKLYRSARRFIRGTPSKPASPSPPRPTPSGGGPRMPSVPRFNPGSKLGGRLAGGLAKQGIFAGGRVAFAALFANPVTWIVIGVIILILLVILMLILILTGPGSENPETAPGPDTPGVETPIQGLRINKSGPSQVEITDTITYSLNVTYTGTMDVTIIDPIPQNTEFLSATGNHVVQNNAVLWQLQNNPPGPDGGYVFTLTIRPLRDNSVVVNNVTARALGSGGNIANILPNPLPPEIPEAAAAKREINRILTLHPNNVGVYEQAEAATGVPWQIFAGKHYVEGGSSPTKSLVSGRVLGTNEPDVVRAGGCSSRDAGAGKPIPVAGGCGFATLLDSAIYAGNILKGKIGGNVPQTFEEAVKAVSLYNGGGNRNCALPTEGGIRTPYTGCPRLFQGEDDPYTLSYFDTKHKAMYLVYCADLTRCNPPRLWGRPGVFTIIRGLL